MTSSHCFKEEPTLSAVISGPRKLPTLTSDLCLSFSFLLRPHLPLYQTRRWVAPSFMARSAWEEDPNYESRLPDLLKKGMAQDRPDADVAKLLRARYQQISQTKSKAAAVIKPQNPELAAELEEIADELMDTHEKFVTLSTTWDAWSRPDPNLPSKLRAQYDRKVEMLDEAEDYGKKSVVERPDPNLPSTLRMLKYKQGAEVKRMAAKEVRTKDPALADELEEMADEIEDSHRRFEVMVSDIKKRDAARPKIAREEPSKKW